MGDTNKNSCIERSLGLKCVHTSSIDSLRNLSPLHYSVQESRLFWYFSCEFDRGGGKLFAFRRKSSILSLLVFHIDMTSSMNLFQKMDFVLLCQSISISILAINMLAKATAIFKPWYNRSTDRCQFVNLCKCVKHWYSRRVGRKEEPFSRHFVYVAFLR